MCINIYLPFWQLIYSIYGMVFEWTVQIRLQWTGSGTMERKRSWYLLNPILDGFLHCKWTMNFLFLGQHPLCQTPLVSCLLPFLIQCFFLLPLIPHSFLRLHRNIKTGTEKLKKKRATDFTLTNTLFITECLCDSSDQPGLCVYSNGWDFSSSPSALRRCSRLFPVTCSIFQHRVLNESVCVDTRVTSLTDSVRCHTGLELWGIITCGIDYIT